jgi:TRAP-type C4-dicarboxylate transport system permease small subunit
MSSPDETPQRPASDIGLIVVFGLIIAIILAAVFFRYVLNRSLFWSDELVRYLFVWFTFWGSALVLRDRRHIRVEFFVDLLPARWQRLLKLASLTLVIAFNAALVVLGLQWAIATRGTYTPALGMPLSVIFYCALPTGALLTMWFGFRRLQSREYGEHESGAE